MDLDPGETDDIASEDAEALSHAELARTAAHAAATVGAVEGEEVELDCESICQLCQIGYERGESCARCNCR